MKKILVAFVLFTLISTVSISVNADSDSVEKLAPIYVNNHEMVDTLGEEGLFLVYRKIEMDTPISNAIKEALSLELTQKEKDMGFSTEWGDEDHEVTLKGVSLGKGKLTIELNDPFRFTSGGSARVRSLKNQIKETALQFKAVDEVHFIGHEHLFQP